MKTRLLLGMLCALVTFAVDAARPNPGNFGTDQIVVRLKPDSGFRERGRGAQLATELRGLAGENLIYRRTTAEGHKVLRIQGRRPQAAMEALARALSQHPDVLEALPDRILFPASVPDDTSFSSQWALTSAEGINAINAWNLTTGSASQIVAIIDTGILPHADINAAHVLQGYDFVSNTDKPRSNDSDGRDADATDPGDWVTSDESLTTLAGCPIADSSWHGTAVAGVIAGATNNTAGIAGINWNTRILPIRALGKCGGYTSDVADAILWSGGISVPGVPDNLNPADVINLSFADPVAGACNSLLASAINFVVGQNIPVVVAAGNNASAAANFEPANCPGAIVVGGVLRSGALASYSNTGSPIALSGPAGDVGDATVAVLTTSNGGTTFAVNDNTDTPYRAYSGTSIAAAHVTGVVSLMQAVNPTLGPADIKEILRNTVRTFPLNSGCTPSLCGDGIVNAQAAVQAAASVGAVTPHIAGANEYSAGVRSDGTVWSWGRNTSGQFGTGVASSSPGTSPVKSPSLSGITINAAGFGHALGLRADAVVFSWGDTTSGKLGRTGDPLTPGAVPGLDSVTRISAGNSHSLAQRSDGTVWAWGSNSSGRLGIGPTPSQTTTPLQVTSMSGAIRTLAGRAHSVALKSDGTVWAWGDNSVRQLGNGTTVASSNVPVQVSGITNAVAIATNADADHSLALLADGTVMGWGSNFAGQLGNNSLVTPTSPTVVAGLANVAGIATGASHSLAMKTDGTVVAWGLNTNGQVGDGTIFSPRKTPVAVLNVTDAVGLAGGASHSLALKGDGSVMAWGANTAGQLGQAEAGTPSTREPTPVVVKASGGANFGLDLGLSEFLAQASAPIAGTRESNTVTSSAPNGSQISVSGDPSIVYRIGNGAYTNATGTVNQGQTVTARMTAAGTCNTTNVGTVTIGGTGHDFSVTTVPCDNIPDPFVFATQAGVPASSTRTANPITVSGINTSTSISVTGGQYSLDCSTYTSGAGTVTNGQQLCVQQVAPATLDTSGVTTLTIGGVSSPFFVITAADDNFAGTQFVRGGATFSLGLRSDGTLYAWGRNSEGQLGNGTFANSVAPVQSAISGVTRLGAGSGHSLALRSDGTVWTWGANGFGQLGDGTTSNRATPTQVPGLANVSRVAGGFFHSVALRQSDGTVWTWGYNGFGQLGDGSTTNRLSPVQVGGLTGITRVAGGDNHTIALDSNGNVWAWGDNTYGQLGDGTNTRRTSPVHVSGLVNVVEIGVGSNANHALALKADGTVWAWGRNNQGQIGDNTTTDRWTPIQVLNNTMQIAVGEFHSVALRNDATVYAWGWGANGRLGDGTTNDHHTPTLVQGLSFATMIAAGGGHSLAVRPDGTVVGWGFNFYGQVGDGTTTDRPLPTVVQAGALNLDSNASTFTPQANVPMGEQRMSNTIRITGINDGASISSTNGEYSINGGAFTTTPGTINDRDQVALRQFASANCNQTTTANVFVGGAPRGGGFSVTTVACDGVPDPFGFDTQQDQPLSTLVTSNTITVTGTNINAAISISGGTESMYSLGCAGGGFTSVSGTIMPGQMVCVRHRTSSSVTSQTTTTLTIGGVPGTFTTTTAAQQTLTVNLSFTGLANGSVVSTSPANAISCPSTCATDFNPGQSVTLLATPDSASVFTGWSGACSGTGSCTVTVNQATFVTANFTPAPTLSSVKSRKTHGGAGTFDLPIDYTAPIGSGITVEPRAAVGNTHKIVFTFDVAISDPGIATCTDAGANSVGSASAAAVGTTVEVTLTGVPDNRRVMVTVAGVNGARTVSTAIGFISGDVDGLRSVTASDILRAKGRDGATADSTNFVYDVDVSGTVGSSDISAVRANSGSQI